MPSRIALIATITLIPAGALAQDTPVEPGGDLGQQSDPFSTPPPPMEESDDVIVGGDVYGGPVNRPVGHVGLDLTFMYKEYTVITPFGVAEADLMSLSPVFRGLFDKVGLGETETVSEEFAVAAGQELDALFGE